MTHTPITAFVAFHLPLNTVSSVHAHRSNSVHSFGVRQQQQLVPLFVCEAQLSSTWW